LIAERGFFIKAEKELGVPTVKQFHIKIKKDEILVLFAYRLALQGIVCYTIVILSGGKEAMLLLTQK